ncbi:3'(2'),5'-bisphosphate nucleotidase CysQ [Leptolyngbya sp. PCC 6406]|uniref:3'(2'),5'-bisphosphate nucleotidase CysQ family protein n=1 Tax=Leptolyngbya sp. PCC 6406 TaxID=1173264 RepID=UPI0002ACDB1A|nr:inositol monophosphatase family protein [Leptolyngbya sp. PCC 6406]
MPPISDQDNGVILATLQTCGQQAREAATQAFEVFEKGVEDYVTTVDRVLDQVLAAAFATQFPQDSIITEENQGSAAAFQRNRDGQGLVQRGDGQEPVQGDERIWLIDPIDGTEDFIHHGENYAVMVGLLAADRPQAGWIYGPAHQHLYWGGPGWGLFQLGPQGETLPLVPCSPPDPTAATCPLVLGTRDQRRFGTAIAQYAPQLRPYALGSYGLKVMEVIKGQSGLYVYCNGRVKLWDTTGPLALALAAGLVCCDLDGIPIRFDATSIYPLSLIHRQPILVGWPSYIERFREPIRQAVQAVRVKELGCLCP